MSATALVEERFLMPVYGGARAPAWIASHGVLSLPLRFRGTLRYASGMLAGRPVSVAATGSVGRLRALLAPVLDDLRDSDQPIGCGLWRPAALARVNADLVVAEVHRWAAPRFRRAGWTIVPDAVRWEGALAEMPPSPIAKGVRDDLRKVRRYGYVHERAAGTSADWQEFVESMVRPQAAVRFAEDAWYAGGHFLDRLRAHATLHFVRRDGVRVAGMCGVRRGDRFWLPLGGVRDGDPRLLHEGAWTAAWALTLAWARAEGCRTIDAGRTGPRLSDGVARYKRKWGLRPVRDPLAHLLAVRFGAVPGLAHALAAGPLLSETDDGLSPLDGMARVEDAS